MCDKTIVVVFGEERVVFDDVNIKCLNVTERIHGGKM